MEPKIEHAMGWLREGAIVPDAEVDPRGTVGDEDLNRRARAMRRAFASEEGRLALETILRMTLFRPPVNHRLGSEGEYLRFAQLREGQNQTATGILAYLDHADTLEKTRHEHTRSERPGPGSDPGPFAGAGPLTLRPAAEPEPGSFGGAAVDPTVAVA